MSNYADLLNHPNVLAFLALIRHTEGAGYHTLFGGGVFDSLADHPRRRITRPLGGRQITSTAAGAYQFLAGTWDEVKQMAGLPDFSEHSQDVGALFLIERRGALRDVLAADWISAISKCNREWASLPGSPYGQPTHKLAECMNFLRERTAASPPAAAPHPVSPAAVPETTKGTTMLPIVAAALPALINAAPTLIRLFGSSEQTERNAKAVEVVAALAREITAEPGIEQAVDKIATSPEAAADFRQAVEDNWYRITSEVGGGIAAARTADRGAADSGKPWLSPALWVSAALLPLVYMVVSAVLFGSDWPTDIKAMVVSAIISGVLGSITGFYLGTSFGSQRKTDLLVGKS